jgi:REP element-mobilizing transposase RayT
VKYDPAKHHRTSIRLKGYNYTQPGAYFVTLCTHDRECLFGEILNGNMRLSRYGKVVRATWFDLPNHYRNIHLDEFCIMPNHVHAIIVIIDRGDREGGRGGSAISGVEPLLEGVNSGCETLPARQTRPYGHGEISLPEGANSGCETLPARQTRPYAHGVEPFPINTGRIHGLSEVVRAFKSFSARRINSLRGGRGLPVWQRNYYEHIIRDESEYQRISRYILDNPQKWESDQENPAGRR